MSWYTTGAVDGDKLVASTITRRTKNFFTKPGEPARIRFLKPADDSFNYKRCFVPWAKGQKLLTVPPVEAGKRDPFTERGLQLQASFAWPIIDRRIFEFEDKDTGEQKKSGPRILFFADGQRTRKQLQAFEKEMLADKNEEREENGEDPLTIEDWNLTHYDVSASKEKKAPWNFVAKRAKPLTKADTELIEKAELDLGSHEWLAGQLRPLEVVDLRALLNSESDEGKDKPEDKADSTYSYSDDDDDDTVSFDD